MKRGSLRQFVSDLQSSSLGCQHQPRKAILDLVHEFEQHRTINDLPHSRRRSVHMQEKHNKICTVMEEKLPTSSRRVAQQVGISHTSTYHTMRSITYPHRTHAQRELKEIDGPRRVKFRSWLFCYTRGLCTILDYIYFSDEAWFTLDGFINSQNYIVWSAKNPHTYHTTLLHQQKIGAWTAILWKRMITGVVHWNIMQQFITLLERDEHNIVFQQDNARLRVTKERMEMLRKIFGDRIIEWPTYTPKLSPLNYFLWGMLKNEVHSEALPPLPSSPNN